MTPLVSFERSKTVVGARDGPGAKFSVTPELREGDPVKVGASVLAGIGVSPAKAGPFVGAFSNVGYGDAGLITVGVGEAGLCATAGLSSGASVGMGTFPEGDNGVLGLEGLLGIEGLLGLVGPPLVGGVGKERLGADGVDGVSGRAIKDIDMDIDKSRSSLCSSKNSNSSSRVISLRGGKRFSFLRTLARTVLVVPDACSLLKIRGEALRPNSKLASCDWVSAEAPTKHSANATKLRRIVMVAFILLVCF